MYTIYLHLQARVFNSDITGNEVSNILLFEILDSRLNYGQLRSSLSAYLCCRVEIIALFCIELLNLICLSNSAFNHADATGSRA